MNNEIQPQEEESAPLVLHGEETLATTLTARTTTNLSSQSHDSSLETIESNDSNDLNNSFHESSVFQHLEIEDPNGDNIIPKEKKKKESFAFACAQSLGRKNVRMASIMTLAVLCYFIVYNTTMSSSSISSSSTNMDSQPINEHSERSTQSSSQIYPDYSIFPTKMYTVVGLESSGTTFTTSLLENALGGVTRRECSFHIPSSEESSPIQVQHCSLPEGNVCSPSILAPTVDIVLPASCSEKMILHYSKECQDIGQELTKKLPFSYPGRYFLDLVRHKKYYDQHNTQQYLIIVVRDQSMSLASRESIHCKYHGMALQETQKGLALIQDAIDTFILNPSGEYEEGVRGGVKVVGDSSSWDWAGRSSDGGRRNSGDSVDFDELTEEKMAELNEKALHGYGQDKVNEIYYVNKHSVPNGDTNDYDDGDDQYELNTRGRRLSSSRSKSSPTDLKERDSSISEGSSYLHRELVEALKAWDTPELTRQLHTHYQNSNYLPNGNGVVIVSYELMNQLGNPYIEMLYRTLGISSTYKPVIKDGNKKYVNTYGRGIHHE